MESSARRSRTQRKLGATHRSAYTLVELMVTVTILGILATIAVPMFKGYLYRSKTNEASGFLMEIKNRQVSYRSVYRQYYDVSETFDNWYPSDNPGSSDQAWPSNAAWNRLGAQPPGRRTLFSYVTVAGPPGTGPSRAGFSDDLGFDGSDFWFVARALGDLDDDGTNVTFEAYSESQNIWCSTASGWE